MTNVLLRTDKDGLCTLTLNRPDKLNALNTELFRALDEALAQIEKDASIGCVVVAAAGKAFCAGADLTAMGDDTPPPTFKPQVLERLSALPQPVIVRVHGTCVTGGLELALASDLIIAGASARFADTHGKWGFVGGWGMSQRLPRRIGNAQAKLMMMTGKFIDAASALRIGLIDVLAADDALDETMASLTSSILANSWHTVQSSKKLIRETDGMSLREGLAHEHYRFPGLAPDYKERVASFSKKS